VDYTIGALNRKMEGFVKVNVMENSYPLTFYYERFCKIIIILCKEDYY
jgi:hypothetical protein